MHPQRYVGQRGKIFIPHHESARNDGVFFYLVILSRYLVILSRYLVILSRYLVILSLSMDDPTMSIAHRNVSTITFVSYVSIAM
jgi:hypothetical protein